MSKYAKPKIFMATTSKKCQISETWHKNMPVGSTDCHNAFSKRVSISHPTLRRLVKKIMQEQGSNEIVTEQLNAAIAGPPQKKVTLSTNS